MEGKIEGGGGRKRAGEAATRKGEREGDKAEGRERLTSEGGRKKMREEVRES